MLQIIECEQSSDEWHAARAGIPTASEFSTVMAKGKDGGPSLTRKTYMYKLAGEIITKEPTVEGYSNASMERGKAMEKEARDFYSFLKNVEPRQVGFIRNGPKGCSPDSLIGDKGGLEIKTKFPHLMIECLLRNDLPPEHKAQVQGSMWVAEREFWDFMAYWPKMPPFIIRVHRDESYILQLKSAVSTFNDELAELVEKVRRLDQRVAA